jgi:hypothetical protein
MRKTRKRFRTPAIRDLTSAHAMAIRSIEGIAHYKHSTLGRAAKSEAIGVQWQIQGGICSQCNTRISIGDAKFARSEFQTDGGGDTIPVIHKHCPVPIAATEGL